jgi:hypothetical protein
MDDTTKTIVAGMIRHGLTMLGGALVAKGYMDSGSTAAFVGGGMALVGVIWSWWQKDGQAKTVAILAKMHPVAPEAASQADAVKAANIAVAREEAK